MILFMVCARWIFVIYDALTSFLAQQWISVEVIELDKCARGAIKGRKKDAVSFLHEFLSLYSERDVGYVHACRSMHPF